MQRQNQLDHQEMEAMQSQDSRNSQNEEIKEMGSLQFEKKENHYGIQLLTIIGEIEGHEAVSGNTKATKYEHLLPRLAEIQENVKYIGR